MGRSRAAAKAAGTRTESAVTAFLARVTGSGAVERRVKSGAKDRGDVNGVFTLDGARVIVEVKDHAKLDFSGWLREAEVERVNDGAEVGVVVAKKRGAGSAAECYYVMDGYSFAKLLTCVRPEAA